jgi:uncharacterized protein (DUF1499 family)
MIVAGRPRWSFCAGLVLAGLVAACGGSPPVRQSDGSLSSCDGASDCVRSGDADPEHAIAPLRYAGSPRDARLRLLALLKEDGRVRIVVNVPNYVHAEVEPAVLGPYDDLEFLFSAQEARIDMRAAKRGHGLGNGDNRARLESLRRRFESSSAD